MRTVYVLANRAAGIGSPLEVSGLAAWYDFSDPAALFQDSGRTTAVTADGDPIGGVTDKSGAGRHLAQATAAKRATYRTGVLNGRSVGRFDGVDDFLKAASFSLSQPETVVAVLRIRTGTVDRYVWDGDVNDAMTLYQNPAGGDARLYAGVAGPQVTPGTAAAHLLTAIYNGASSSLGLDNGTPVTGTAGSSNAGGFTLGAAGTSGAAASEVDVGEVILCGALSATDEQALREYLNRRWTIY